MKTVTYEHSGPPTFKTLCDAYYKIVWGYTEPDIIRCSRATKAKLIADVTQDARMDGDRVVRFCNATLVHDDSLDDHTIVIGYSKPPEYFRQHKQAYQVRITLEQGHVSD